VRFLEVCYGYTYVLLQKAQENNTAVTNEKLNDRDVEDALGQR